MRLLQVRRIRRSRQDNARNAANHTRICEDDAAIQCACLSSCQASLLGVCCLGVLAAESSVLLTSRGSIIAVLRQ